MSLSLKIAYNTLVQIIAKVASTILGLLALALMTRYLGQADFGAYTTAITFISFFAIIADLGLTLVTVQIISDPKENENKAINNLFSLRLLSALFFLGLGPLIVLFFPYSADIKQGVTLSALAFLFVALNQIFTGLFQKKLSMAKASWAEIIGRAILLGGVYLTYRLDLGLSTIFWFSVLSSGLNFLLMFLFAQKFIKLKLEFDAILWKKILQKTWPLAVTIAFNLIYLKTDTLILSLSRSQEEVGIYGSAYKIIDVLVTVPFMFAGIILPLLTKNWLEKNYSYFIKIFQKSLNFMIIAALPLSVGAQFLAKDLMVLVAGPDFAPAAPALKILILAASLIFIGCIFSHGIIALDKQKKIIPAYIFTSLTALLGYFLFIPKFSYFGAAWTTVYSELVIALAAIYYFQKYSKIKLNYRILHKALGASLIMGLALYFVPPTFTATIYGLTITLVGAAGIYFLALYAFKGLDKNDLRFLKFKKETEGQALNSLESSWK